MKTISYLLTFKTKKALALAIEKKISFFVILMPFISFFFLVASNNWLFNYQWEQIAEESSLFLNLIKRVFIYSLAYTLLFSSSLWFLNIIFKTKSNFKDILIVLSYSTSPLLLGSIIIILSQLILGSINNYSDFVGWDEYAYTLVRLSVAIWSFIIICKGNIMIIKRENKKTD